LQSKLDFESSFGNFKIFGEEECEVESLSHFASVRANTAVFAGKFYYEVRLLTSGLMQIGWCTLSTPFSSDNGVGDDDTSFSYDGDRIRKWNAVSESYGEAWAAGDVIGTLMDLDKKEISFYRNDKNLGVAFKNIKVGPNMAYFPAISFS